MFLFEDAAKVFCVDSGEARPGLSLRLTATNEDSLPLGDSIGSTPISHSWENQWVSCQSDPRRRSSEPPGAYVFR
jgi:hypothetical protein